MKAIVDFRLLVTWSDISTDSGRAGLRIKSKPHGRLLLVDMREAAAILGFILLCQKGRMLLAVLGWGSCEASRFRSFQCQRS